MQCSRRSKDLEVRSAIDVMHVMKNLCVTLLGFLGVYGKTKDMLEAQEDQQRMYGEDGIHQGHASYALTKEEKEIFFECLLSIKVVGERCRKQKFSYGFTKINLWVHLAMRERSASTYPCRSSGSVQENGVEGVVLVVIQITGVPSAKQTAPPCSTHVRSA